MEAKEIILYSNYKKFGIKKSWTKESKKAALNAMEEYADQKLKDFIEWHNEKFSNYDELPEHIIDMFITNQ
jgi:hypothetical protein